jgi:hypothetical protein
MPLSFPFLLNSQSNNSSRSSSDNDSKSDDDGYYKKRTIRPDNDMLERPSDHSDSCSQSDGEEKTDLFASPAKSRPHHLSRQATFYDDDWPRKRSIDEDDFMQTMNRHQATRRDIDRAESRPASDPHRYRSVSRAH